MVTNVFKTYKYITTVGFSSLIVGQVLEFGKYLRFITFALVSFDVLFRFVLGDLYTAEDNFYSTISLLQYWNA